MFVYHIRVFKNYFRVVMCARFMRSPNESHIGFLLFKFMMFRAFGIRLCTSAAAAAADIIVRFHRLLLLLCTVLCLLLQPTAFGRADTIRHSHNERKMKERERFERMFNSLMFQYRTPSIAASEFWPDDCLIGDCFICSSTFGLRILVHVWRC